MTTVRKESSRVSIDNPVWPTPTADGSLRTIEFEKGSETYRIEIADTQRFTYGPFAVGAKGYGSGDNALRIYEGANKDNQLAVFRGVDSVRDLAVKLRRKIRTEDGQRKHVLNADGSESESVLTVGEDWVEV